MTLVFKPRSTGEIDVCAEGIVTHYGPGICDRFAPYGNDSFEEAVRDYCGDSDLTIVSVGANEIVAESA